MRRLSPADDAVASLALSRGYVVSALPGGMVKIEGQRPMTREQAVDFLAPLPKQRTKSMRRKSKGFRGGSKARRRERPSRAATAAAFREVYENEPAIVGKTRRKYGTARADAQKKAIALSKARRGDY